MQICVGSSCTLVRRTCGQHHGQRPSPWDWDQGSAFLLVETSPFLLGQFSPPLGFWPWFRSWTLVPETVLSLIQSTKENPHNTHRTSHPFQHETSGCCALSLPPCSHLILSSSSLSTPALLLFFPPFPSVPPSFSSSDMPP